MGQATPREPSSSDFVWKNLLGRIDRENLAIIGVDEAEAALDAIHRTMYKLGPTELHTITGYSLREFASAGLLLADIVYRGVHTDVLWSEEEGCL